MDQVALASRRQALRLARLFGLDSVNLQPTKAMWNWDGKRMAIQGQSAANIMHELAHWLVCPPSRRSMRDFGLGPSPDVRHYGPNDPWKPTLSRETAQEEEGAASLLGIVMMSGLGLPDVLDTLREHGWLSQIRGLIFLDHQQDATPGDATRIRARVKLTKPLDRILTKLSAFLTLPDSPENIVVPRWLKTARKPLPDSAFAIHSIGAE